MKRDQFCRVLILACVFTAVLWLGGCGTLHGIGQDLMGASAGIAREMARNDTGEDK